MNNYDTNKIMRNFEDSSFERILPSNLIRPSIHEVEENFQIEAEFSHVNLSIEDNISFIGNDRTPFYMHTARSKTVAN